LQALKDCFEQVVRPLLADTEQRSQQNLQSLVWLRALLAQAVCGCVTLRACAGCQEQEVAR
jgi:hypothetical protein